MKQIVLLNFSCKNWIYFYIIFCRVIDIFAYALRSLSRNDEITVFDINK